MSDFAAEQLIPRGNNKFEVVYGDDKGLYVEFDTMPELQEFASEQAGRAIHKDVEIIKIYKPGVMAPTIRKVQPLAVGRVPSDYDRWPAAYAAFKNKTVVIHEGTSLEAWAPLTKSDVMNFKAANIHTVEQLAEVPDTAIHGLGLGGRTLRDKAVAFIASAGGNSAALMRLTKENENLRSDIDALKNQIAQLGQPEIDKQKKGNKSNG